MDLVKERGYRTILISGSNTEVAQAVAELLGIDEHIGSETEISLNGIYTGRVVQNLAATGRKSPLIRIELEREDVEKKLCFGMGDSGVDDFLLDVDYPVAINPNRHWLKL